MPSSLLREQGRSRVHGQLAEVEQRRDAQRTSGLLSSSATSDETRSISPTSRVVPDGGMPGGARGPMVVILTGSSRSTVAAWRTTVGHWPSFARRSPSLDRDRADASSVYDAARRAAEAMARTQRARRSGGGLWRSCRLWARPPTSVMPVSTNSIASNAEPEPAVDGGPRSCSD